MSRTVRNHRVFDAGKFAQAVRAKRGAMSLREAGKIIGLAGSNLMRIERAETPEVETFLRLCAWLGASPNIFSRDAGAPEIPIPSLPPEDAICALIRADRSLEKGAATALLVMVGLAYKFKEPTK